MDFFSYTFSKAGISPDPEKVTAMPKFPRPPRKCTRNFLGLRALCPVSLTWKGLSEMAVGKKRKSFENWTLEKVLTCLRDRSLFFAWEERMILGGISWFSGEQKGESFANVSFKKGDHSKFRDIIVWYNCKGLSQCQLETVNVTLRQFEILLWTVFSVSIIYLYSLIPFINFGLSSHQAVITESTIWKIQLWFVLKVHSPVNMKEKNARSINEKWQQNRCYEIKSVYKSIHFFALYINILLLILVRWLRFIRLVPVINDILVAINEIYEAESCERESEVNAILKTKNACKQGLDILSDLCLQPAKPRWVDLTDAGPGVGVSNYEVRFRDAELARIHNSDYRVRCHRSRGDSGQGEAERTNSAISDALVDGATLEWEKHKRFEDLTKEEIKNMSLHTYEEYEKKRMEKNAWHVCKMVAERIDEAPVLNEYINSRVSEPPEELFFFNSTELNTYRNASVNNKMQVPGSAYFTKIEKFIDKHYLAGELFMEFCRIACKEQREGRIILCSWCSSKRWVGPETDRDRKSTRLNSSHANISYAVFCLKKKKLKLLFELSKRLYVIEIFLRMFIKTVGS